jgi:hypothetical protein
VITCGSVVRQWDCVSHWCVPGPSQTKTTKLFPCDLKSPPTMQFPTMTGMISPFIFVGALYFGYLCGGWAERKKITAGHTALGQTAAEKLILLKANAKSKSKAKTAPKTCSHSTFTTTGSNQHKTRKRCKICDEVFEIKDA